MSIFNFFKQKKEKKAVKEIQQKKFKPLKEEKVNSEYKSAAKETKIVKKSMGKGQGPKSAKKLSEAYKWLKEPHITEKATSAASLGKYTFKVIQGANKPEIKKAVESFYEVGVVRVSIINIPRKRRRLRGQEGWRAGYKKAIVTLREGDKIEVLPH